MQYHHLRLTALLRVLLLAAGICGQSAYAKGKKAAPEPRDQITRDQIIVEAHVPVTGSPVTRFVATRHHSSTWVYAVRESGNENNPAGSHPA